jgi:diadenosine tetraphosphate (Ap4A) HIT family hydrolase
MQYKDFLVSHIGSACPFCGSEKRMFFENDAAFLTYALAPYHPHHLLIIPRRHTTSMLELSQDEAKDLWELIRRGIETLRSLGYQNYSLLLREGDNTGKSIPHLHYHLIPVHRIGDLDVNANEREILTDEEISRLSEELHRVTLSV